MVLASREERRDELISGAPVGCVVPHAGWRYSGAVAARGIAALFRSSPQTVVVFGAVHVRDANEASIFRDGAWLTPLGLIQIDSELGREVLRCARIQDSPASHLEEHSIEVEVPIIQHVLGEAIKLLPIMVQPGPNAREIGREVATAAKQLGRRVVFLASTDLTHYGPAFGFEPQGRGAAGIRWAKEVNDRRFVRRVAGLDADGVVPEANAHRNACGAGAVAATIAAVAAFGASAYVELEHSTSADRERANGDPNPINSVGYEAGVFVA